MLITLVAALTLSLLVASSLAIRRSLRRAVEIGKSVEILTAIRRVRMMIGRAAIVLAALLYAVSFFLPAVQLNARRQPGFPDPMMPGYHAFLLGFFALLLRIPAQFVSLANPAFWVANGTAIFGRWRISSFWAVAATALGLTALLIYDPNALPPLPRTNDMQIGAQPDHVIAFGPGYYCWVSGFCCLALGALLVVSIDAACPTGDFRSKPLSPKSFFHDAAALDAYVGLLSKPWEMIIRHAPPFNTDLISAFVIVVWVGCPQMTFALLGGFLSRKFRIAEWPDRTRC